MRIGRAGPRCRFRLFGGNHWAILNRGLFQTYTPCRGIAFFLSAICGTTMPLQRGRWVGFGDHKTEKAVLGEQQAGPAKEPLLSSGASVSARGAVGVRLNRNF